MKPARKSPAPPARSRLARDAVIVFVGLWLLYGATIDRTDVYDYALQQFVIASMVSRGTYAIGDASTDRLKRTVDTFLYDGRRLPAKQPGQFTIGFLAYLLCSPFGLTYARDRILPDREGDCRSAGTEARDTPHRRGSPGPDLVHFDAAGGHRPGPAGASGPRAQQGAPARRPVRPSPGAAAAVCVQSALLRQSVHAGEHRRRVHRHLFPSRARKLPATSERLFRRGRAVGAEVHADRASRRRRDMPPGDEPRGPEAGAAGGHDHPPRLHPEHRDGRRLPVRGQGSDPDPAPGHAPPSRAPGLGQGAPGILR